jgi:hypothetical protein
VTNASRHYEEFTRTDDDIAAVFRHATDAQRAAQHKKHLVFMGMRMPRKRSLYTNGLDVLIVDPANHTWRPKLRESFTRRFQ